MIDADAAKRIVAEMLEEAETRGGPACVVVGEPIDFDRWWVQGYQSRAFVEDGDFLSALAGNGPIAVPKDGSPPFALSAAEPADVHIARLLAEVEQSSPES
ncbi:YrhB domain-containing protein [Microbacterium mangrovi]|nr:YrhB domain-containing protein [Microbacterium mangrovi]